MRALEKLQTAIEEITSLGTRDLIADALADTADRLVEVPPAVATRPFPTTAQVPSCESQAFVWVAVDSNQRLRLHFAVENPQGISAKALAVLLAEALTGAEPAEAQEIPEDIVYTLFGRGLGINRAAGLRAMITLVKTFATRAGSGAA